MISQEKRQELYKIQNTLGFSEYIDTSIAKHPDNLKTMITMDIDRFASINDKYGFDAGDEVIYQTFIIFKDSFQVLLTRPESRIVRIGGDEFGVYLIDASREAVEAACQRTLNKIHNFDFSCYGIKESVSASIGILNTYDVQHSRELYHLSTKALLDAKRKGKNTYILHEVS